jgi:hypothetical protein
MNETEIRYVVVACARWETRYIAEWLNYYQALGFDQVFLYCNDDDPQPLYEKLLPYASGRAPFVTFRYYPEQGHQFQMYSDFLKRDLQFCRWVAFFDIDEYLRLPAGLQISDFVRNFPESVDCVMFNWVFFGPNGHKEQPGKSIIRDYSRRQAALHPFTKYIAKASIFTGPDLLDEKKAHGFWHNPIDKIDKPINAVNVLGEDMSHYYDGFPSSSAAFVNDPVRSERILATSLIHHYAFRTESAFKERVARGLGGAFDGQVLWGEIASGDKFESFIAGLNAIEDKSLVDFWPNYLKKAFDTNILLKENLNEYQLAQEEPKSEVAIDQLADLFENFLSLGINCELGVIQKAVGVSKLGLLDWFATYPDDLCRMLESQFDGIGDLDQTRVTVSNDEYILEDIRYHLRGHSFVRPSDIDQDKFYQQICWRLKYLKRKLIEELELGECIFVYKMNHNPVSPEVVNKIAELVSHYGPGFLLSISDSNFTGMADGHVERTGPNLITAHLAKLAPYDHANEVDVPGWATVCAKTLKLVNENRENLKTQNSNQNPRQRGLDLPSSTKFIRNIARGCAATQSSISEWSRRPNKDDDARGAVDGNITGKAKFHTDIEDSPWWQVDLSSEQGISEIKLYNRVDQGGVAERASRLAIEIGSSPERLIEVYRRETDEPFGGIDGNPLIFKPTIPMPGRFIRIRLLTRNYLHLDQVEIYGESLPITID